jgi:hypothetical protein
MVVLAYLDDVEGSMEGRNMGMNEKPVIHVFSIVPEMPPSKHFYP